jgi:hypothetical protein
MKKILIVTAMVCASLALMAQITAPSPSETYNAIKGVTSWEQLLTLEGAIMSMLIVLGGYISWLIPGLKAIHSNTYRIATFAILIIAGAIVLGISNVWQGAISYLFATGLYQLLLKPVAPTPKPHS